MEDDEAAPTQFKIETDEENEEKEKNPQPGIEPAIPNLWFVLSPNLAPTSDNFGGLQTKPYFPSRNVNLEFCPLCQGKHRIFYCCDCITKGEFMHSNPRKTGDLADKRLQEELILSRKTELATQLSEKVSFYVVFFLVIRYFVDGIHENMKKINEEQIILRLECQG